MIGSLKFFGRCGVLLALTAKPMWLNAELKPNEIYRRTLPCVMTLEIENAARERFVGSAFLAFAEDTAITAWHVVSDARSVWATFADGQRVKVIGCIDKDVRRDLAAIRLERNMDRSEAVLDMNLQDIGSRVYVIGSPRGFDFSLSDGLVSQIRPIEGLQHYQISCPISPGNSGGPVLNGLGEVIAVTSWRRPDAQNLSFAVPAREVAALNFSQSPTSWEQLAPSHHTPSELSPVNSQNASTASPQGEAMGGFRDLKKQLEKSAGKEITIVVQDGRQENKFRFVVPREGLD